MRYVIINELFRMGGSEVQSLRELKTMIEHGHETLYITFDSAFPDGIDKDNKNHINLVVERNGIRKKLYRGFTDPILYKRLCSILKDFNPNYIHVNNATDHAPVIYKAVSTYHTFQTIRDYGAVCPTALCVDKDYRVCNGKRAHCCTLKCMPKNKKAMFIYYNAVFEITSRQRKNGIEYFVCPSQKLTEYCNDHGLPTTCVNNPFDFGFLNGFQKKLDCNKKTYLFYGFVAEHKGIRQLLNAFEIFSKDKTCELLIAGKITDVMSEEVIKHGNNIHYIGVKPYNEIIKLLERVYAVVVPSLWMENYPNTVLEGLCTECIVLASERGGMKEMIRDDRFIFDVLDQQDIVEKLNFSYALTKAEHDEIIKENLRYVKQNNSLETYYSRIMDVLQTINGDAMEINAHNANI